MALVTPTPVASASLPLADPADRTTFGPRMRETLRWQREDLAPGVEQIAEDAYTNALHAQNQALVASSVNGFLGLWVDLTGPAPQFATTEHVGSFWVLNTAVEDITAFEPGVHPFWVGVVDQAVDILFDDTDANLGAATVQEALLILAQRSEPPGKIGEFAMQTPPAGWLHANGSLKLIADYPDLYAVIGTLYGGDGVTTFGLPDVRGRTIRGWDDGAGRDPGRVFGSTQEDQNRAHTHTLTINAAGEHTHTIKASQSWSEAGNSKLASGNHNSDNAWEPGAAVAAGNHTHTGTASGDGGTETRVKNIAFLVCIKY